MESWGDFHEYTKRSKDDICLHYTESRDGGLTTVIAIRKFIWETIKCSNKGTDMSLTLIAQIRGHGIQLMPRKPQLS